MKHLAPVVLVALIVAMFSEIARADSPDTQNVVTIHNYTWNKIGFQIRAEEKLPGQEAKWSQWYDRSAAAKGHHFVVFYGDVQKIQIRYDRIVGDGQNVTEQIYDLKYTTLRVFRKATHKDGEPYYFQRKGNSNVLELYHQQ